MIIRVIGATIGAISGYCLPAAADKAATTYVRLAGHQHTASRCERMTAIIGRTLGDIGRFISTVSGAFYGMNRVIASEPVEWKCVPNHQGPAGGSCSRILPLEKAKAIESADNWFMIGCISTVIACLGYSLQTVGNRIEVATLRELLRRQRERAILTATFETDGRLVHQQATILPLPARIEPPRFHGIRPRRVTNRLTHNTQIIGGQGNSAEANRFVRARRLG